MIGSQVQSGFVRYYFRYSLKGQDCGKGGVAVGRKGHHSRTRPHGKDTVDWKMECVTASIPWSHNSGKEESMIKNSIGPENGVLHQ